MVVISDELMRRARDALVNLKMLSDAKTSGAISALGHQQKATSSPPPETRLDKTDERGIKERSLYEYYLMQFERCNDEAKWRLLCYLAERDYEKARQRPSDARRAPLTLRGRDGAEMEREALERITEWYAGIDAQEVAVLEECSVQWVHKARRQARRDEETGLTPRGWAGMSDEERQREVKGMMDGGFSLTQIAESAKVSTRTVQRYARKART